MITKSRTILLFQDEGVSTDSSKALLTLFGTTARCVSGHDLQQTQPFFNAQLFIIPGGRSLPYYEKLGKRGNDNIRKFVAQGGVYVGLCAGAYYACHQTIFAKNLPLELVLAGELNFFSGAAIGPVFASNQFAYASESGARLVDIIWQDGNTNTAYVNGGCYFKHAEKYANTKILAKYQKNQEPAIIACSVGLGYAILSGVHPELTASSQELDCLWQRFLKQIPFS